MMHKFKEYDVAIIGGGASGMMAAISAAMHGKKVILLEKNNRLGEKLRITGGGRCNIWNEEHDERLLLSNYGENSKFLFSTFARFSLNDTIDFFHKLGLKTKVEAKKRAFPVSDRAEDVVRVLSNKINELGVEVFFKFPVTNIGRRGSKISFAESNGKKIHAKSFIFATGGLSRPETGSTGDGFRLLKHIGHTIHEPSPTITPLAIKEKWPKELSGTTLANVGIEFYAEGSKSIKLTGDVLCTHFGISGPLILNNASKINDLLKIGKVTAKIDCFPEMNEKQLDRYVIDKLSIHGSKNLSNSLKSVAPSNVISALQKLTNGIDYSINTAEISRDQRIIIVKTLKNMNCTVTGLMGFDRAVIADGGVNIKEIDTKNMQSKIINNVYITGDLIHINRPSGGYSLQLCWSTGYVAGASC